MARLSVFADIFDFKVQKNLEKPVFRSFFALKNIYKRCALWYNKRIWCQSRRGCGDDKVGICDIINSYNDDLMLSEAVRGGALCFPTSF